VSRTKRILIVDDEEQNRLLYMSILDELGHEYETAQDGIEALAKLELDIDLVLLDVKMPHMDGFEVARRIRRDRESFDVPIIMITALASREDRIRAVEAGANDFIAKPADLLEIQVRTASLLRMKDAQDELKRHKTELEEMVKRRTDSLRRSLDRVTEAQRRAYAAQIDTIHRLALAAEYKDKKTAAHIRRIGYYCSILGKGMDLSPGEVEIINLASPMHDVGKIGIPDEILLKKSSLTPVEFEIIKSHTTIGSSILQGSSSELLRAGEVIALSHHERWDGTGYPNGIAGDGIPLYGRICAVADNFDALTTKRPYKEAFSNERAIEIIREGSDSHFDPKVVAVFNENLDAILKTRKQCCNGDE